MGLMQTKGLPHPSSASVPSRLTSKLPCSSVTQVSSHLRQSARSPGTRLSRTGGTVAECRRVLTILFQSVYVFVFRVLAYAPSPANKGIHYYITPGENGCPAHCGLTQVHVVACPCSVRRDGRENADALRHPRPTRLPG